jgi:hypothetical protein
MRHYTARPSWGNSEEVCARHIIALAEQGHSESDVLYAVGTKGWN